MKILNEDGSVLYEFQDGLGAPLLYRVFAVAKFTGEVDPLIALNKHVAAAHSAIAASMPVLGRRPTTDSFDDMARRSAERILVPFRSAVLEGQLDWLKWTADEKAGFAADVLWAPWRVSTQFISDFVEDQDRYFATVRKRLSS